jgi:hypothetical protein
MTHLDNRHRSWRTDDWQAEVTFQTLSEVTCVYGIDGKCSSILTPQCLSFVQDAYNSARHQGVHALLSKSSSSSPSPPIQHLATEIHRLIHRLPRLSMTGNSVNNTKAECSRFPGSAHPLHDSLSQLCPGHKREWPHL